MSGWLPQRRALESPQCPITMIVSTDFIPKEHKGEGKEKIVFSEWRVLEVRTGFLTETMGHVHPAAFSLLLSLPILRLSICL